MRILVYSLIASVFLSCQSNKQAGDSHNSLNALDWVGVYRGVLPCTDCEGISTMIHLKKDLTYIKSSQYQGKSSELYTQNGSFQWNREGTTITLMPWEKEELTDETKPKETKKEMYQLGENQLIKLDAEGKHIQGPLARNYVLKKQDFDKDIREKYWRLIALNGKTIVFSELQKRETHFVLRNKDNRVLGHGGCNAFSGAYELLEGNRIRFSSLTSTKMACAEIEYESEFFQAIQNTDNYSIKGDTLSLNKGKMATLARLVVVYFR